MKKLKKLNFNEESLERNEMKEILGGSGGCGEPVYRLRCPGWVQSMVVVNCSLSTRKFYCGCDDADDATCVITQS
tara:strand:+ start:7993 stop:8217 length:225 start_codon:yes stop_codon:yes gene_type:complete